MTPLFITGIGTDVGKTLVSAIVCEALRADYWKPVQAGTEKTDSEWIRSVTNSRVHAESYRLKLPASPHIAAREENKVIDSDRIYRSYKEIEAICTSEHLVIEGAGGLMVPLNDDEFVIDLIQKLDAHVILVSKNYLGSINHSLLTAEMCRKSGLNVIGWVFNDQYLNYENEIVHWSGYEKIASIPKADLAGREFILQQAEKFNQSWKLLSPLKQR